MVDERSPIGAALSLFAVVLSGAASGQTASPAGIAHVADNAALSALTHTAYPAVVRDGYATAGDAPSLTFYSHAAACSLNAGTGDGGSEVPTSDRGCWKANFPTAGLDVRQFGARCDGSTNDTAPAQAAETYLESLNGGALVFPARSCVVSLIIANNNVTIEGVSRSSEGAGGAKLIAPSTRAAVISVGKVSAFTLKDLTITSPSQQVSGALVALNGTALANIDNVFISHGYNDMIWTNVGGPSRITGGEWNDFGNDAWLVTGTRAVPGGGNDYYVSNLSINEDDDGYSPRAGIEIVQNGGSITLDTVDIIHAHNALWIDPGPAQFVDWVYATNTYLDSCDWKDGSGGVGLKITPAHGGIVNGGSFANDWSSTCTQNVQIQGDESSPVSGIKLTNFETLNALHQAIYCKDAGDIEISNSVVAGASRVAAGRYSGIELDAGCNHVSLSNIRSGATVEGFGATQKFGLQIDRGFSGYLNVTGGDYTGNAVANLFNGSPSAHISFVGAAGINPLGPTRITPGASPWTYRAGPTQETLILTGGTVSSVAYAGPIIVCTSTPCQVNLAPNQPIHVTYSATPAAITNRQ
jgi:hypothetical protein